MAEAKRGQTLTGEEIKNLISTIVAEPRMCGFEAYVITKSMPRLKKMGFVEEGENNLRQKLKNITDVKRNMYQLTVLLMNNGSSILYRLLRSMTRSLS